MADSGERSRITKGRGATLAPSPRYLATTREEFDDGWTELDERPKLTTTITSEWVKTIISRNKSPDLPFEQSINPYRGCEHGCVYCYARPTHAYLDLSPGLDFESRLFAKMNAPEVLREELAHAKYQCSPIALGANTDAYQPCERQLEITRKVLTVLSATGHPVTLVTKAALIERDIDLLGALAARTLVEVFVSVTTLDHALARKMEPRATAPMRRLETIRRLTNAGIPVGVMIAPLIPGLNDDELETILEQAAACGARTASYVMLRLPREVSPLFQAWLEQHYPLRAQKVMNAIRNLRGGRDYESEFGTRMHGRGPFAEIIRARFARARQHFKLNSQRTTLSCAHFMAPTPAASNLQLSLF